MIYGNPSYEAAVGIQESILLKELIQVGALESVIHIPPPSMEETIQEVWEMVALAQTVDSRRMDYIVDCEKNLYSVMSRFLSSYGIEVSPDMLEHQLGMFDPIENYLKVKFNRPRPFQVAGTFHIPLYPLLRTDASTASYPSGHTLTCLWFRHIYMKTYPHLADDLMDFVLDVRKTREEGGVHFPSDGAYSILVYHRLKHFFM